MTQIVSSISSIEIYAPSAGSSTYAKCDTNGRALTKMVESADVSAYQVVSATGSQLYAGTAHLTSVNQAPISAARAGNAANASMANSAYYDGAGRLISSLPDSATVSAIASGYASSKADASSLSSYALSADVSGVIDTVSSNSASWAGGGGVDSATVSAIASSYADKCWPLTSMADLIQASGQGVAISYGNESLDIGKAGTFSPMTINYSYGGQPTANFHLNNYAVYGGNTSNNTSYYWILNRTGVSGRYYDGTAKEWHYTTAEYDKLTSTHDTVSANSATWGQGGGVDSATVSAIASSYAESAVSSKLDTTAQVVSATAGDGAYITSINGMGLSGPGGGTGNYWPISASGIESTASAIYINHQSNMMTIIGRSASYSNAGITFKEDGHPERSAGLSYTHVFGGNTSDASGRWWSLGLSGVFASGGDLPGAWKYGSAEYDYLTSTHDTVSSNSASWGQSGPITATASAKATAYTSTGTDQSVFTGVSSVNGSALLASNLLPNAQQANGGAHFHFMPTTSPWGSTEYTGLLGPLQYATGATLAMKQSNQYGAYYKGNEWFLSDIGSNTAANGVVRAELHRTRGIHLYGSSLNSATGFHLNGSGVDGKSGTSAWQYGPVEYNMLIDVNNTVTDQSANWGGSALALSAGPGVKLEKVGDTLVAGLDETVLWSGSGWTVGDVGQTINLSEEPTNFSIVKVYGYRPLPTDSGNYPAVFSDELDMGWLADNSVNQVMLSYAINNTTNQYVGGMGLSGITSTSWKETGGFHYPIGHTKSLGEYAHVHKVVGINRTAGV